MSQPQPKNEFLQGWIIINATSTKNTNQYKQIEKDFLYKEQIDIQEIETNIKGFVPAFINYQNFTYYAEVIAENGALIHQYQGKV